MYTLWRRWLGGALTWPEFDHQVFWLWGSLQLQAQVSCHLSSASATNMELQSNLQMAATCVGLVGAQLRPSCELRVAAASAISGTT